MSLKSEKSQLQDIDKLSNTLITNCPHCGQKFKERENLIIIDGKVLHNNCAPVYQNNLKIAQYKTEFPYLDEEYIDKIIYTEGEEAFSIIRENNWILLMNLSGGEEMTLHGFFDEDAVKQFIIDHFEEENNEQDASIEVIYFNGNKYHYNVSVTVTLSEI